MDGSYALQHLVEEADRCRPIDDRLPACPCGQRWCRLEQQAGGLKASEHIEDVPHALGLAGAFLLARPVALVLRQPLLLALDELLLQVPLMLRHLLHARLWRLHLIVVEVMDAPLQLLHIKLHLEVVALAIEGELLLLL